MHGIGDQEPALDMLGDQMPGVADKPTPIWRHRGSFGKTTPAEARCT